MRKYLFFIGLGIVMTSCSSQKKNTMAAKKSVNTKQQVQTSAQNVIPRVPIQHQGQYDFFKTNISTTKGDNSISYGSIVSAEPKGYKVKKDFFPSVAQNFRQKFIVIHYTALNNDKSINVLTTRGVSSHYLVNDLDDKEIYQLVDENKRAYHAGVSYWRGNQNLNDTSIGIEIVNLGYTGNTKETRFFYEYPEYQFKKIAFLIKDIAERYDIPPTGILGHSDIAPTRKEDPGPKFPWKRLYTEYNLGMWYDDDAKVRFLTLISPEQYQLDFNSVAFISRYQTALNNFGYNVPITGYVDSVTQKTIEAFQYRFRPEKYDGVMDMETWAILQALLEKYPSK